MTEARPTQPPDVPGPVCRRRVRFAFPEGLDPVWNRRSPEVALAADAVSLLMPHVEPYVIRSVRAVEGELGEAHAHVVRTFVDQEAGHQREHRRFNELVVGRFGALAAVERWAGWAVRVLERRGSARFGVAFAAAFETIAYSVASWAEAHHREVFGGGDEVVVTLFMWHLAEEVEHKSVVFDLLEPCGIRRPVRALGAVAAVGYLAWFTLLATVVMTVATGRILSPAAWWRLTRLSVSLAFEVLGDLAVSFGRNHHPDDRVDPTLLCTWLRSVDPATATIPLWPTASPVDPEPVGAGTVTPRG